MRSFASVLLAVSAVIVVVASQEIDEKKHHTKDHPKRSHSHNDVDRRGPVYDALKATIDDAYHYHKSTSQELSAKINRTQHLMRMHLDMLKENNQAQIKIEALKMQGEHVIPCLYEHEEEITDIAEKWVTKIDACTMDVQKNIELIAEEIFDVVSIIYTAPLAVRHIQDECINDDSAGQSVLCVVTKLAALQEKTYEATHSSKMIIGHIVNEFQEFVGDIQNCEGLNELNEEVMKIVGKIEQCARNHKNENEN